MTTNKINNTGYNSHNINMNSSYAQSQASQNTPRQTQNNRSQPHYMVTKNDIQNNQDFVDSIHKNTVRFSILYIAIC